MPKLTDLQKSALDIIDIIHFFNIYSGYNIFLSLPKFRKEKEINSIFFDYVLNLINEILEKNGIEHNKTEIFKHYILCGIEINFNKIDYEKLSSDYTELPQLPDDIDNQSASKIQEFNLSFSIALMRSFLDERGINFNLYTSLLYKIIEILQKKDFPSSCYFRLTLRALSYEFPVASIHVYKKFLDLGILKSEKYTHNESDKDLTEKTFFRSLLAIEFEIFRDFSKVYFEANIGDKTIDLSKINFIQKDSFPSDSYRDSTVKYYRKTLERILNYYYYDKSESFYILRSVQKNDVNDFLDYFNENYIHHNFFSNRQSNLSGILGAQVIFNLKARYNDKRAIYYDIENSNTLSQEASDFFNYLGIDISARTLYLHYKKLNSLKYEQIKLFEIMMHISIGYPWNSSFHDLFLFAYKYNPYAEK